MPKFAFFQNEYADRGDLIIPAITITRIYDLQINHGTRVHRNHWREGAQS